MAAHAECSTSSCITYEAEEAPHVKEPTSKPKEQKSSPTHTKTENNAKAEGSAVGGGSGESTGETGGQSHKSSEEGSSNESEKNPSTAGGGGGGNKPNGGGGAKPEGGGAKEDNVAPSKAVATPASHSTGDSSSPVVPILIAVAVLAAISIGVVLYRQRKAGAGPDGRVSSPDAS